jgi:serine/threonine protein kinase
LGSVQKHISSLLVPTKEKCSSSDIKPQNIVIWVNPEHEEVLSKWADFGLSKQLKETESYSLSNIRGTEGWFAPEILKILDDEETSRTEAKQRGTIKSDVFSEGLVFGYYLLKGNHLFGYLTESNTFKNNPVRLNRKSLHLKYGDTVRNDIISRLRNLYRYKMGNWS